MAHLRKLPAIALIVAACMLSSVAYAKKADAVKQDFVDCNLPGLSLQDVVSNATEPTEITFVGPCVGDVTIESSNSLGRVLRPIAPQVRHRSVRLGFESSRPARCRPHTVLPDKSGAFASPPVWPR